MDKKAQEIMKIFTERCRERFGKDLVSIVLFGSHARGTAEKYSDIDLLLVVKDLPTFNERIPLISEICYQMLIKHKVSISPILMTPEEFKKDIKAGFPLFLGVVIGYKAVFDRDEFSTGLLTGFSETLDREGARFKDGVWTVPSMSLERQHGRRVG